MDREIAAPNKLLGAAGALERPVGGVPPDVDIQVGLSQEAFAAQLSPATT